MCISSAFRHGTRVNDALVVILCDPQLKELTPNPKKHILKREPQVDHNTQTTQDIKADDKLINTPFQGGYIDFMPPPRPINGQAPPLSDHPHESMLGDLIYYYTKDCARLDKDNDWLSPTTSAFFLKKIVAAHYLQLADYIKAMLPSLELKLTTAWVEEREQWKGLQIISRRCGNYRDDIEDTLLSLGYPLEIPRERGKEGERRVYDCRDCEIDYQYVYFRLKILKERADNLMTSMTGLASIAGNRQNLEEAKRVKRLNLLALLFIPLAYTSSLFSMQDEYAPNKPQFWVYWVCAIGVVVFTSVVTFILDRALNDAAEWTIPFKKLLVGGEKGTDTTLNRVTTGFYGPSKRTRTG